MQIRRHYKTRTTTVVLKRTIATTTVVVRAWRNPTSGKDWGQQQQQQQQNRTRQRLQSEGEEGTTRTCWSSLASRETQIWRRFFSGEIEHSQKLPAYSPRAPQSFLALFFFFLVTVVSFVRLDVRRSARTHIHPEDSSSDLFLQACVFLRGESTVDGEVTVSVPLGFACALEDCTWFSTPDP